MTSDRAFRDAIDEATAIHQVMQLVGSQLDPTVAEALVAEVTGGKAQDPCVPPDPQPGLRRGRSAGTGLLGKLDEVQPIPALLIVRDRLLEALAEKHPNLEVVVAHIESDPGLTLSALRSANADAASPTVSSIPEAISVLGWVDLERTVRQVSALDFLWPQTQWEVALAGFRLHAVTVQRAALRLGDACGYEEIDRLASAALLHDIGRLALAQLRSGYLGRLEAAESAEERLRMERRDYGFDHATLGGIVARRYGLSDALAGAISEHHNVQSGQEAQLLCLGDALAHQSQGDSVLSAPMIEVGHALGLSADLLRMITFELPHVDGSRRTRTEPCPLSPRQQEALQGLAEGKVYGEIARDLGVKTSTVRTHLHSVYRTLDVTDRAQAVLMATERGWL